ncbi:MAG: alanine racemase [Rhodospirillales bacterium]|nr:alanine racemase [Rhodospirillales bacterium]
MPASAELEVDLGALVANWRSLAARHPTGPVAGVLKANAYGMGVAGVGPALHAAGCRHFFVATLDEALALRPLVPGAMLAVLGGLLPDAAPVHHAHDVTPVLASLGEVAAWRAMAASVGHKLPAIIQLDTGMARLGLDPGEVARLRQDPGLLDGITVRYYLTHLVSAEIADDPLNPAQRDRFAAACAGLPPAPRSLANSSGLFLGPGWHSDLARPGAALYGINPTPGRPNPMRRVATLRTQVLTIREIPAGTPVGYNATWHAGRPSRIATAGIGYADGLHRSVSGRATAFFDGRPAPLVGRVSMDLTTYDVTDLPGIVPGSWLTLIGAEQGPDDLAIAAGTNGYEVLTSIAPRVRRLYRPA